MYMLLVALVAVTIFVVGLLIGRTGNSMKGQVKELKTQVAEQAAIINGFGSFAAYAQYTAIMQGLNPFQPTYLVNGTK